jgi:hypothetical protein
VQAAGAGVAAGGAGAVGTAASGGAAAGAGAAAGTGSGASAAAPAAAAGAGATIAAGGHADTTAAAPTSVAGDTIPVPPQTQPLGESPNTFAHAISDTMPAAPPPVSPPPQKALPDSCWRIQIAAPTEKDEATLKRQAAESVLLVPFVIEQEKTRYKVRSRECLSRDVADKLRRRALQSGFDGAFPVLVVKGRTP